MFILQSIYICFMKIAETLKKLRKLYGMTQVELAEAAGLTQVNISHMEGGIRKPARSTIESLGKAFGVPGDALLAYCMDLDDVKETHKEAYAKIDGSMKAMMDEIFEHEANEYRKKLGKDPYNG